MSIETECQGYYFVKDVVCMSVPLWIIIMRLINHLNKLLKRNHELLCSILQQTHTESTEYIGGAEGAEVVVVVLILALCINIVL
jgi:hypothetical protein